MPGPMQGTLTVTLHRGRNLKNVQMIGKQDPYCELYVQKKRFKSKVHDDGGLHPVWDETFIFEVDGENLALHIICKDQDTISDETIGRADIDLDILCAHEGEKWYSMKELNDFKKLAGDLLITCKFVGTGAPAVKTRDADSVQQELKAQEEVAAQREAQLAQANAEAQAKMQAMEARMAQLAAEQKADEAAHAAERAAANEQLQKIQHQKEQAARDAQAAIAQRDAEARRLQDELARSAADQAAAAELKRQLEATRAQAAADIAAQQAQQNAWAAQQAAAQKQLEGNAYAEMERMRQELAAAQQAQMNAQRAAAEAAQQQAHLLQQQERIEARNHGLPPPVQMVIMNPMANPMMNMGMMGMGMGMGYGMGAPSWQNNFPHGRRVRLTSVASGGNLGINPHNFTLWGRGQMGDFAIWTIHNHGTHIRLELAHPGIPGGQFIAVRDGCLLMGVGGPFGEFVPEPQMTGTYCFLAKQQGGRIGVVETGDAKPPQMTGQGPHGQFYMSFV